MLSSDERPKRVLVEGCELSLPAATAIPLGFIVSELITNAAKYGDGRIAISLQPDPAFGHELSVRNGGPALPDGFDPGASTGLGMRIIQSFARQIGGELRIGRGDDGHGALHRAVSGNARGCRSGNVKPGNARNVGIKALIPGRVITTSIEFELQQFSALESSQKQCANEFTF